MPRPSFPPFGPNALRVLEKRYLRRDARGRICETPEGMFERVACAIAEAERAFRRPGGRAEVARASAEFHRLLRSLEFLPNTPTLMNAGTGIGQLCACFVLPVEDSIAAIFDALRVMALIHQSGGGTGFSFSRLRPRDDLVGSTGERSSGPVSFMGVFDRTTEIIRQGGRRRGANMGILRMDHPDIREFVACKSEPGAFRNFNLSVAATDAHLRAAIRGGMIALRNPRTGRASGRLPAREILRAIAAHAHAGGDPGMVFLDAVNRSNPTPALGPIEATNPCGEQPLLPWEACTLGSLNLAAFVREGRIEWERLGAAARTAVRFLDDVLEANRWPHPEIERMARRNRKIGLGVMGFADFLLALGLPYGSDAARRTGARLMRFLTAEARRASADLAEARGPFPAFRRSIWPSLGFRRLRNATVTTVAPTGTISILAGVSSGIEPLFAIAFVRRVLEGETLPEVNAAFREAAGRGGWGSPALLEEIARTGSVRGIAAVPPAVRELFRTALDLPVEDHLAMQAAFQRHTDNAVSKTVNLPPGATPADVEGAYLRAWRLRLKGITVYRYGAKPGQVLTLPGDSAGAVDEPETACERRDCGV